MEKIRGLALNRITAVIKTLLKELNRKIRGNLNLLLINIYNKKIKLDYNIIKFKHLYLYYYNNIFF